MHTHDHDDNSSLFLDVLLLLAIFTSTQDTPWSPCMLTCFVELYARSKAMRSVRQTETD